MYDTSDFRNGLKIEYDNLPYVIIDIRLPTFSRAN